MKNLRRKTIFQKAYRWALVFLAFFVSFVPVVALDEATYEKFASLGIMFYDPDAVNCDKDTFTPDGKTEVWEGAKYNLTDAQKRGLLSIAVREQGYTIIGMKTSLSQMANLFEIHYKGTPGDGAGLANYVHTGHADGSGNGSGSWYSPAKKGFYNESYEPTHFGQQEFDAVEEVLVQGHRTIPQRVTQHGGIDWVTSNNNGTVITNPRQNLSQFKRGVTKSVEPSGTTWTFYTWADPSEANNNPLNGDPYGYEGDTPYGEGQSGTGGSAGAASGASASDNKGTDYAGNPILTEDEKSLMNANTSIYKSAVNGTKIPWQMLAAIHYRESRFAKKSSSKEGVFGLKGGNYATGKDYTSQELEEQAKAVVKKLETDMGTKSGDDAVKYAFFKYDNDAEPYKSQARDLSLSEAEANNGEGSPYVMNKADEARDPAKATGGNKWGYIKDGENKMSYPVPDNYGYGAFVVYGLIASNDQNNRDDVCGPGNTQGNMDVNQTAIDFAWPLGDPHNCKDTSVLCYTPTPAYEKALKELNIYTKPAINSTGGGSSCDVFVSTVMKYSGVDPHFITDSTGYEATTAISFLWKALHEHAHIDQYTLQHKEYSVPNDYDYVDAGRDPSKLRPGDIGIQPLKGWPDNPQSNAGCGHIVLYVEIDGKGYTANASWHDNTGQISKWLPTSGEDGCVDYRFFRHR